MVFIWMSVVNIIEVCNICKVKIVKSVIEIVLVNDIILIKKGIYKEYNIDINKFLIIIGENYLVIDGELKGEII